MRFVQFTRYLGGAEVMVAANAVTLIDHAPAGTQAGCVLSVGGERIAVTVDREAALAKLEEALAS